MALFVTGDLVIATILPFGCGKGPASDGAHRLAWWLADRAEGDALLWQMIGAAPGTTERLVNGSLEPDEDMAIAIARATGGAVLPTDWLHGGPLGWREQPYERVT